ncbi:glycoside hydrolase family 26 protein [Sorangium sp. So ce394]|uniref:glycoside hydrolase family 26 protein n=1 Tax=Sorangium sp. So ce394 TaxID=3133310 RepID=UPI003F5B96F8
MTSRTRFALLDVRLLLCAAPSLLAACSSGELAGTEPSEQLASAVAQTASLAPTSDVALDKIWGGGGTAPIFKLVDDGTSFAASDGGGTFARSAPGAATASLTLGYSGAPAGGARQVVVNYQAWAINGGAGTVRVHLYDGDTLLGSGPARALSASQQNLSETFGGLAVANGDRLRTELVFQNTAGTGSLVSSIVWIDVTTPDDDGGGGTPPDEEPAVSDKLVPRNGAWWGAYNSSRSYGWDWGLAIKDFEAKAGRKLDIVYRYHDWGTTDNGVFPDRFEAAQMNEGYIVHLSWESRRYSAGQNVTWTEIANGSQDAVIRAAAERAKNAPGKFMIAFDHEMDNTDVHSADGPDADYVAAYRRIVDMFRAAGATNVVWVWTPMGWSGTRARLPALYPGDTYVDWIGYDPYNFYECNGSGWKDPATTFGSHYDWMHAPAQMAWHGEKPYILSEFSSHEDPADPNRKGQWMRGIVDALKRYPDIKAVQFYNSNVTHRSPCKLAVDSSSQSVAGYAAAGSDPYVNQPHH